MFISIWISDGDDDIYMTLDILWNAVFFFLQRKKKSIFYADPIYRKNRLSKK